MPETPHSDPLRISEFRPEFRDDFYRLNKAWIDRYFEMEAKDHEVLGDPETHILGKGGRILVALSGDTVAGVCALIPSEYPEFDLELAKMAVSPAFQGKGIGKALGKAVIAAARESGASTLFLESSTHLPVALALYRNLGFTEVRSASPSPYRRSDIQMVLRLAGS